MCCHGRNAGTQSNTTTFTVKTKSLPELDVDVDIADDIITVEVLEDAVGDVDVIVDGEKVSGKVSDDKIIVDISDLAPGNHSVEVIYDGDKYASYDETTDFEVPKVDDYTIEIGANDIVEGSTTSGKLTTDSNIEIEYNNCEIGLKGIKMWEDGGLEHDDDCFLHGLHAGIGHARNENADHGYCEHDIEQPVDDPCKTGKELGRPFRDFPKAQRQHAADHEDGH